MLFLREVQSCDGYYYHMSSGAIWRVVGPGEAPCFWAGELGERTSILQTQDVPEFELLTSDVDAPFAAIQRLVQERYGCLPTELVNRQTARQPDGSVATEEAQTELSPGAEAQRCRSST